MKVISSGITFIKRNLKRLSKLWLIHPSWLHNQRQNISASKSTIASVLTQVNDHRIKSLVYYLSRILNDIETRYSSIEKLCLCLYYSCVKLKYYIKSFNVIVLSYSNIIKYMLSKSIMHNWIGKWSLALVEFSLTITPLKSIKGQIVIDFLVNHTFLEVQECNMIKLKPWMLYFDGSNHAGVLEWWSFHQKICQQSFYFR